MKKWQIDRRTVLKAGGASIALPLLEAMFSSRALAAGENDPKRYICMYIASGSYIIGNGGAFWYPSAAGALNPQALPAVFQPFAANAAEFSILRGLVNSAKNQCGGTGGDHSTSVATYLTGAPYTDGGSSNCTISGSSFDQEIAARNGLKAYALSASGYDGYRPDLVAFDYGRTISYKDGRQAECWLNPYKLFYSAGLFQNYNPNPTPSTGPTPAPTPAQSQRTLARNKSILDNAITQINSLRAKLGSADRQRLDDYLTGLRDLEKTFATNPGTGGGTGGGGTTMPGTCSGGVAPSQSLDNEDHTGDRDDFPDRLKAFCDVMILALKCDKAQAFSLMYEYENTGRRFRSKIPANLIYGNADMNRPGSHIDMAHWEAGGPAEEAERRNRLVSRDRFYMSYVDYLITQLKSAKDPSGSPILDNTIIQFGHGLFDGNHSAGGPNSNTGLPTVLAGGRNVINPGRHYVHSGVDLKDLYYTINQKLGMGLANFRGSTRLIQI